MLKSAREPAAITAAKFKSNDPASATREALTPAKINRKSLLDDVKEARRSITFSISEDGELSNDDIIHIAEFIELLRRHRSNSLTPIEDGIIGMVEDYVLANQRRQALTPDDLIAIIEAPNSGCRSWFDDAVEISRDFRKRYAAVLDAADAAEVTRG